MHNLGLFKIFKKDMEVKGEFFIVFIWYFWLWD